VSTTTESMLKSIVCSSIIRREDA